MKLSAKNGTITLISVTNKDLQAAYDPNDSLLLQPEPPSFSTFEVPEGVAHIAEGAFLSCTNMQELNLPDSIQEINDSTIATLSKLKQIVIKSNNATKVEEIKSLLPTPELRNMVISHQALLENLHNELNIAMEEFMATGTSIPPTETRLVDKAEVIPESHCAPTAKTLATTPSSFWASIPKDNNDDHQRSEAKLPSEERVRQHTHLECLLSYETESLSAERLTSRVEPLSMSDNINLNGLFNDDLVNEEGELTLGMTSR